jgi:hypothetical protein
MLAQQAGTPITPQQQQYLIVCGDFISGKILNCFSFLLI